MTNNYILFSIGPVQSAISQARRTQDLFMGSRILSWLVEQGLRAVKEKGEVIFPQPDAFHIPNHIFVHCSEEKTLSLVLDVTKGIKEGWKDIAKRTQEYLGKEFKGIDFNPRIWKRQVTHWLEIYHVVVPDTGLYYTDYQEANRLLAARKLIRNFDNVEEPGHKCSLTGEHEALHNQPEGKKVTYPMLRNYWDNIRHRQRNLAMLSKGERLCALAVIKRMAYDAMPDLVTKERKKDTLPPRLDEQGRFPSTSSIASMSFRSLLINDWMQLKDKIARFLEALESLFKALGASKYDLYFFKKNKLNPINMPHIDNLVQEKGIDVNADEKLFSRFCSLEGSFLYLEGLQPAVIQEYARSDRLPTSEQLKPVYEALSALYQVSGEERVHPSSYLAVLAMDGDHMGQQTFVSKDEHRKFSCSLVEFVEKIVEPEVEKLSMGRVVFAGGDDLLFLLPIKEALTVAEKIRKGFSKEFKDKNLHMSAGIAFVHRTHPLQEAVQAAQAALEQAKETYRRDAISIALLKRSGEPLYMGMKWQVAGQDDRPTKITEVINNLADAMATNQISHQLPYELEHVVYATPASPEMASPKARFAEFKRVFERRCQKSFDGSVIRKGLENLAESGIVNSRGFPKPEQGWEEIALWTRLARFLAAEESKYVGLS